MSDNNPNLPQDGQRALTGSPAPSPVVDYGLMPDVPEDYVAPDDEDYGSEISNEAARQLAEEAEI